jgi:Uma2 family endonuclease
MTTTAAPWPLLATMAGFRRFSVAEYHRLTEIGILTEDDNLELLEGYLVLKMSRNPPHAGTLHGLFELLQPGLLPGWQVRIQSGVTLPDSEPEPDLAIVRKDANNYRTRHPNQADVGLVVEVADSTLPGDRADKGRIYARAGIPIYWIVNIPDHQVEVYESPSGPTAAPGYARRTDLRPGDALPVILDGATVATLAVQDVFA